MKQLVNDIIDATSTGAVVFVIACLVLHFLPLHLLPAWDAELLLALAAFTRKLVA